MILVLTCLHYFRKYHPKRKMNAQPSNFYWRTLNLYGCSYYVMPPSASSQGNGLLFNSLAPGKFEWNFRYLTFQIISVIDGWIIAFELALRWMSLNLMDDESTLVQVITWCRQATSHHLRQCWPRSLSPYEVTSPQWVDIYLNQLVSYHISWKANFMLRIHLKLFKYSIFMDG